MQSCKILNIVSAGHPGSILRSGTDKCGHRQVLHLILSCKYKIHLQIQNKYKEWSNTGTSLNPVLQVQNTDTYTKCGHRQVPHIILFCKYKIHIYIYKTNTKSGQIQVFYLILSSKCE